MGMVITAGNSITPLGYNSEMTAASVRGGISRLVEAIEYYDTEGNPIIFSSVESMYDHANEVVRIEEIAHNCLSSLLQGYFRNDSYVKREINLLIGVSSLSRPGPRYEGLNDKIAYNLLELSKRWSKKTTLKVIASGECSSINCIEIAGKLLEVNPNAMCIIGGIDSLLAFDTLDWFEQAERLKSETFGRNQGIIPSEGVGFLIVESKHSALLQKKQVLAELKGIGLSKEPAPFLSDKPSRGEGLSEAIRIALSKTGCAPGNINHVIGNLNGEYYRSKEWGLAEIRCFGNSNGSRKLWHPADCMGSVGAASGVILINLAIQALYRGWMDGNVMIFCSDDGNDRGTVMLEQTK